MSTVSTNVSAICKFDASTFICGNHEGVIFTFNTETKETRQLLKLKTMASIEKIVVEDTSIGVISDGEAYLFDLNNLIAGAKKIAENVKSFCLQNGEPYSSLRVVKYDGEDNKYYSDIKVTNPKNNINIWIEVKKDKYANYGSGSFTYSDREWKCSTTEEDNPLTKYFIDILTEHS